jgi:hypothetical protein
MSKTIAITSAVILIVALGIGWKFQSSGRVQAVNVQISVKDLPEHGVVILSPSHPTFENRMSTLLKDVPTAFQQAQVPFSVFIENRSEKAVVAYSVKWEIVKADGNMAGNAVTFSNPSALMDGGLSGYEHVLLMPGNSIPPQAARLISMGGMAIDERGGTGIGGIAGGTANPSDTKRLQEAAKSQDIDAALDYMRRELQGYQNITVSMDGVFFADGKFAGPNTTQFFEKMQANIDAKRDLAKELAFAVEHKKDLEEVFRDFEEVANTKAPTLTSDATPAEHYMYYKKLYTQEFLRVKEKLGTEKAISMPLQMLHKPWVKLHKVGK